MTARAIIVLLLLASASTTSSQTVWFKYTGNPVLDVGPSGSWDSREVSEPRVLAFPDTLKMWFSGQSPRNFGRIGYAWSTDGGISWRKHASNPVMMPAQLWELGWTFSPYVTFSGSRYRMWYTGADGFGQIGYAWSSDGITWHRQCRNPVLRSGPSAWDRPRIEWPCVLGPDSLGRFTMWYAGLSTGTTGAQIGYAEGLNETTWTKFLDPVLTPDSGSWREPFTRSPRVLYDGTTYRMWYSGGRILFRDHMIGYATSPDGKKWMQHPSPVLRPGRPDPWDAAGVYSPDVMFDGSRYHMWYAGSDGPSMRIGYAVSPRGARLDISHANDFVRPRAGSVRVTVHVDDPADLAFAAVFKKSDPHYSSPLDLVGVNLFSDVAVIDLLDDGLHGDSLKGDGIFSNSWVPTEELLYYVDVRMRDRWRGTREFKLQNAALFTSVGPVTLERVSLFSDSVAHPGDTILIKLTLRNRGTSGTAEAVRALLSTPRASVATCSEISPYYWDIPPGEESTTDGYYRIIVNPGISQETEAAMHVTVSAFDIPLWYETFTLRVTLPWWRTGWAYAGAIALIGALMFGFFRYSLRRRDVRNELKMKAFSAERLRDLDRMKSRFFANISHEFRTPLTLIRGPATQLLRGEENADIKGNAGMILRNTDRLLTLVNQLLDLSRIEAGTMTLRVGKLDIIDLAKGIAAPFESLAKRKGVEFQVESHEESIVGWFDRDAVEKILNNLLSNAFKFTDSGGKVTLDIRQSEIDGRKSVGLFVSDTGIGIPPDQIGKIFDRFYQVDGSHTREGEGTGIGLSLTRELVELHRGRITVSSEPGVGSTFGVELPIGRESYSEDQLVEIEATGDAEGTPSVSRVSGLLEVEEGEAGAGGTKDLPLILIAEDNADMQKYMKTSLGREYRIIEAMDGEEGVRKAIDAIPDLIVSDVMMPRLDGFALCRKLKQDERTSHIPIILLTAKADAAHKIEGLETGADDYMTKPFDARELLVRVRNLIDQRIRLQERYAKQGILRPGAIAVTSIDEQFLSRALGIVEAHLSDRSYSAELFADEMRMSRMQLHRKMKAITGRPAWEFVRRMRLERAAQLLQKHAGSVAEIAYRVGYEEPTHFTEAFRNHYGIPPSEYAHRHAN